MDNSNKETIVQDQEETDYKEQLCDSFERVEPMDMEDDDNNNNVTNEVIVSKDVKTDNKIEEEQINPSCESTDFDNSDLQATKHENPIEKNGLVRVDDVKLDTNSNGGVCINSPNHDTPARETNVKDDTSVDTPKDEEDDDTDTDTDTDTCSDSELQDQDRTKENKHSDELVTISNEQVSTPPKLDVDASEGDVTGTPEEQALFMKELGVFHKERSLDFRPPKFYGEGLNLLKLYRSVIRLGGYETVTSCKLWRQVGESFNPPKTCTTVSWTFRCFYEKVLLEYEKHEMHGGELSIHDAYLTAPSNRANQSGVSQGSGRARRDAAARAMQGWHSQRLLSNGGVGDPSIKERNLVSTPKREKQLKSIGLLKRKIPPSPVEHAKVARMTIQPQGDMIVVDAGAPADWVKINVRKTKDCFEVYALVPGLLREEVRVQSDPVGRLVITGEPEQLDNHWGVTAFKKVVSLPSRIDPHQTSAVVTLHGQLFIRVPFEQLDL